MNTRQFNYWDNDGFKLQFHKNIVGNHLMGPIKVFFPDGKLQFEMSSSNDEKFLQNESFFLQEFFNKKWIKNTDNTFCESGVPNCFIQNMNNLNGFQRFYYKDGSLQLLIPYVNGRIHGKVYYYTNDLCLDGPAVNRSVSKIKQISNYKKNMLTGPSIFFYESGKIKTRRFYVNNKKSGYYREYFENGNLKMILRFNKKGEKTGNLKIFYENGSLQLSQDFSHDKRHGNFRKYFANGRIKQYKYYQNGMLNGYVKNFNKDNLITFLGVYKQNEPNGYFKKFSYVDGDIFVREMFYIDGIKQGTQIETKNGIVQNIYRYSWSGVLHGIQSLNVDEKIKHSYYEYGRLLLDGNETKQDCCVCYESTNFTTTCNHPLCCKCIQKTMKKCPMCRKNFFS